MGRMITKTDLTRDLISNKVTGADSSRITWLLRLANRYQMRKWAQPITYSIDGNRPAVPATMEHFCRVDFETIDYICDKYGTLEIHHITGNELFHMPNDEMKDFRDFMLERRYIARLWD